MLPGNLIFDPKYFLGLWHGYTQNKERSPDVRCLIPRVITESNRNETTKLKGDLS